MHHLLKIILTIFREFKGKASFFNQFSWIQRNSKLLLDSKLKKFREIKADPFRKFRFGKKIREIKADLFRKFQFGKKFREINLNASFVEKYLTFFSWIQRNLSFWIPSLKYFVKSKQIHLESFNYTLWKLR